MYRLKSAQSAVMYYSHRRQYAGLKLSGILLRLLHTLYRFMISPRLDQSCTTGLSRFKQNVGAQFIAPSSQVDSLTHGRNELRPYILSLQIKLDSLLPQIDPRCLGLRVGIERGVAHLATVATLLESPERRGCVE